MGLNISKILSSVADVLPFGTVAKSLIKGAGSLLFKRAAKAVGLKESVVDSIFVEAERMVEYDYNMRLALIEEEKERRVHELAVFGRFAELDEGSQKLRARIRPLLSFGFCGLFIIYAIMFLCQQLFPFVAGFEFRIIFPPELVIITKWIVGFWFTGRTVEKIAEIIRK